MTYLEPTDPPSRLLPSPHVDFSLGGELGWQPAHHELIPHLQPGAETESVKAAADGVRGGAVFALIQRSLKGFH